MSGELEPRILEGRVFTNGIAQETTREGDVTRVRLTCMPGHPAAANAAQGGMTTIAFPEPVQIKAGETIVVEVEGLTGGPGYDARMSAQMHDPATLTSAHVATSVPPVIPGAAVRVWAQVAP